MSAYGPGRFFVEQLHFEHGVGIVTAPEILDLVTEDELRSELRGADLGSTRGEVVLDISAMEYLEEAALGMIAGAYRRSIAHKGLFILVGASDHVKNRLEVTGLLRLLKLSDTVPDALEQCQDRR